MRRRLLSLGGLATAGAMVGCASDRPSAPAPPTTLKGPAAVAVVAAPPAARKEWSRLAAGNARYAAGKATHEGQDDPAVRKRLAHGQQPYACVLSCVDSRVPPELIFDVGLGEIMTVRSAGQTIDHAVTGSVEFAVEHVGVRLVLVLGHSDCGAVQAAIDHVDKGVQYNGKIAAITDQIVPAVEQTQRSDDHATFVANCIAMQAAAAAQNLREHSEILRRAGERPAHQRLDIVSAVYDIETGLVQRVTASRVRER